MRTQSSVLKGCKGPGPHLTDRRQRSQWHRRHRWCRSRHQDPHYRSLRSRRYQRRSLQRPAARQRPRYRPLLHLRYRPLQLCAHDHHNLKLSREERAAGRSLLQCISRSAPSTCTGQLRGSGSCASGWCPNSWRSGALRAGDQACCMLKRRPSRHPMTASSASASADTQAQRELRRDAGDGPASLSA
jgi:hypothetical protein